MTTWTLTVICPAALRDSLNAKLEGINHGETFTAALTTPGGTEPTHYWSCVDVTEPEYMRLGEILADELAAQPPLIAWFWDEEGPAILTRLGLEVLNR